ncbi:uncharacterized protein LY89DRAFT_70222 [Mollisia scopiformis]|uniref:Uncharacterized protein n=1 Tax=Mollisia scopiformis TaxID=149040 RepID=A0A194XA37_MOLSC|nr:uncharacterized protein LY89DRAFT_70222 [Mollisia scopiformis]KUJ17031.1 hypothetical protein LY89DRAFT_70222 [Mollisia scopiformis]
MDERRRPHKKEGANASSSSPEPTRVKSKSKPQRKKGVERQQVATSGPVFRDRVLSKRITKPVTVKKSSQRGRRRLGGSDANIETSAQPARAGSRSTEILGSEVPSDAIAKNTRRSTKLKAIAESSATGVDDDMGAQQDDTDFMALTDRETLLSKEIHELKQRCEKQKVRIAATRIALHAQQTELQQIQLSLENTRGEYNTVQTNLQQLQF